MPEREPRIVIIGAGPAGLGAAWRLAERGQTNWRLVEQADGPGGLASSVVDAAGFTWDLGGHVLFSHYEYFDRVVEQAVPDWLEHQRNASVWIRGRFIPYPLQNNLWRLPADDIAACVAGLREVASQARVERNFDEWLRSSFGEGLYELFMLPYNRKVWAYHPATLGVGWMGERVATVDLARVLRNLESRTDDTGWGPNARFRFPLRGGTGAIWRGVARGLGSERVSYRRRVVRVDAARRVLTLDDGSTERYDRLVSTMPVSTLLRALEDSELSAYAGRFVHSATHVIGIGCAGSPPEGIRARCWMYFPEAEQPFYRCTVFSNYSPYNVAEPGSQWSLMAEVSESPESPVDASRVVEETVKGMRTASLLPPDTPILSRWHARLPFGYPTPWLGRDEVLGVVHPRLEALGILSRGRFGAWKYEASNQDHSFMQGVQAVDHCLDGSPETVFAGRSG